MWGQALWVSFSVQVCIFVSAVSPYLVRQDPRLGMTRQEVYNALGRVDGSPCRASFLSKQPKGKCTCYEQSLLLGRKREVYVWYEDGKVTDWGEGEPLSNRQCWLDGVLKFFGL